MNESRKKKLLFVLRQTPYGRSLAKEALDAVLAISVYNQNLSVVFIDDGVFQLLTLENSQTNDVEEKNIGKIISVFPLYEVNSLFVCSLSLQKRGVNTSDIPKSIKVLDTDKINTLFLQQDHLFSF